MLPDTKTNEPTKVVYDFSAVDSYLSAHSTRAQSDKRLKTGLGLLGAGVGIGAAAFGLSYVMRPEIITVEKPIITEKVVTVDKPVITERVVTVDKPLITEKVKEVPAPTTPAPQVGERATPEQFSQSVEFKTAEFNGRVLGVENGTIRFSNGRALEIMNGQGQPVGEPTTSRFNGEMAYCHRAGTFANGKERWPCNVLRNGVVLNLMEEIGRETLRKQQQQPASNPFADLFEDN